MAANAPYKVRPRVGITYSLILTLLSVVHTFLVLLTLLSAHFLSASYCALSVQPPVHDYIDTCHIPFCF